MCKSKVSICTLPDSLSLKVVWGMFKNNEAFRFMASYAYVCLDFKDQT